MTDTTVITPDPPENPGLDYDLLKVEGTQLVQKLSGSIWTDYNEHDPGVTTLEQLCYALTELSYRAEFPLESLLIDPNRHRIDTRKQALFVPRRVLPSAPLTEDDYRKLICDRVPGVANVWLAPHRAASPEAVEGLYDIAVYAPDADPCCCDEDGYLLPEVIRERVRRVYNGHRCLCEDLQDVRLLESLPTTVAGDAVIDNGRTADLVLARILFNLGNYLAPELRRVPLSTLMTAGLSPDAIFNGPLLRHGFIADEQLAPKPKAIVLSDVVRVMVRTAGVISVRDVSVRAGDRVANGTDPTPIPVPETQIPRLETRPVDGRYPIRLWFNGSEVKPDPARVERELARLWKESRREYPLARQYLEYFSVPQGKYRDVETYYSIQNQYPAVYGINAYGLPENATDVRKGQARQLKGYLLAFEQLLADFFAQLANVRTLFETDDPLTPTYFYQGLESSVPNVLPLLQDDYRQGLARIVEESDAVVARRNRFLDLLLALYAERLDDDQMPFVSDFDHAAGMLMRGKLDLLHNLVAATRRRGLGFDYRGPPVPRNIAGMAIRSRIELGMAPLPPWRLCERLEEVGLVLTDEGAQHTIGGALGTHAAHIEQNFTPLDLLAEERPGATRSDELAEHAAASLRGHRASETFMRALAEGEIRLGTLPGDTMVTVACRAAPGSPWQLVGKYASHERAIVVIVLLVKLAKDLIDAFRQLYIVEHVLLRFGRRWHSDALGDRPEPEPPHSPPHDAFPYSFTITAVVSDAPPWLDPVEYRAGVAEVIRRNAPAHVVAECCFLRPGRMAVFELLYYAWSGALRDGDPVQIAMRSWELRRFLQRAAAPGDDAGTE